MKRRALAALGLLALVALAGCSAAGSLSMEEASDAEIAETASHPAIVENPVPDNDRAVVRRAVENGSATATARNPPVERDLPFAYEGRYYAIDWNVTGTEPGTAVDVAVDYNGTAPAEETVAFEALSERDRKLLGGLFPPRTDRRKDGYEIGVGGTYTLPETDRSVLLSGEYSAVRYNGTVYPFEVRDQEGVTLNRYRYTASIVADSTAEYADQLREEHLFTLSGLSEAERSVVSEAIDDGNYYAESDDEAFRGVLETFDGRSAIEADEYDGTWLVRYEGEVYVVRLSYGGFDRSERPVTADSDGTQAGLVVG